MNPAEIEQKFEKLGAALEQDDFWNILIDAERRVLFVVLQGEWDLSIAFQYHLKVTNAYLDERPLKRDWCMITDMRAASFDEKAIGALERLRIICRQRGIQYAGYVIEQRMDLFRVIGTILDAEKIWLQEFGKASPYEIEDVCFPDVAKVAEKVAEIMRGRSRGGK